MDNTRDEMVLEVQKWINKTYGDIFVEQGYSKLEENGKTSWEVTNGLIMGLQIELDIDIIAPNFGDRTIQIMNLYGPISQGNNDQNANINQIMKGGCLSTGYYPGNFDGEFDQYLTSAIKELQRNIGIKEDGIVDTKLMKGLLTMNAYVVILGGSEKTREFQ